MLNTAVGVVRPGRVLVSVRVVPGVSLVTLVVDVCTRGGLALRSPGKRVVLGITTRAVLV